MKKCTLEAKATCPICYLDFPYSEIEYHADICSEQFDFVGFVKCPSEATDDDVVTVVDEKDFHDIDADGN